MCHHFRVWSSLNSALPESIENDEYYKEMIGKLKYFEKEFKVKKVIVHSLKTNYIFLLTDLHSSSSSDMLRTVWFPGCEIYRNYEVSSIDHWSKSNSIYSSIH